MFDPLRKHVLCVGLFTPNKNQGEIFRIAKCLPDYNFHFVGNLADNFKFYWAPLLENKPSNCYIHGERHDVDLFYDACDLFLFTSLVELDPLVLKEVCGYRLPILMYNLPTYLGKYDNNPLITYLSSNLQDNIKLINDILGKVSAVNYEPLKISYHFVNGPYIQIDDGPSDKTYKIEFIDNNNIIWQDTIKTNHWTRANRKWFTNWKIKINGEDFYKLNLNNSRVFICMESKSLGDEIAWIPYVDEFRKKHNCKMICSTFFNELFKNVYPEIEFVEPGQMVQNLYAMYSIGCFTLNNRDLSPSPWNKINLQKVATDILGLEYKEVQPKVFVKNNDRLIKEKYICIATKSTARCKEWNNENGWKEVKQYLHQKEYQVIDGLEELDIHKVIQYINHCEFFIGLPSGLSWLAWALNKKVIMISGFSEHWTEFSDKIRIGPPIGTCSGCFNRHLFDKGNWNWCPDNEDFACTRTITSQQVISAIKTIE